MAPKIFFATFLGTIAVQFATLTVALPNLGARNSAPIVDLGRAGVYRGKYNGTVAFFGGVPYAEPPIGPLRFAAPRDIGNLRSQGVVDVSNWSLPCIQAGRAQSTGHGGFGSEDCLKVAIWTPANFTEKSNLPVYVYIHGGNYDFNSPQVTPLQTWVEQSPNFVAVSIFYRLNIFGFLAYEGITRDGGTANAGLLDQRKALEWIQKHISKFGGDPGRVTLGGQSAGGGSVTMQLTAYGGKQNLFHRVITQSAYTIGTIPLSQYTPHYLKLLNDTGCSSGGLACLRNSSVTTLTRLSDEAIWTSPSSASVQDRFLGWLPAIDGDFVKDIPINLYREGKFSKVPVLIGSTTNDGTNAANVSTIAAIFQPLIPLSNTSAAKAESFYPDAPSAEIAGNTYRNQTERAWLALRDSEIACSVRFMTTHFDNTDIYKHSYAYRWNAPDPASAYRGVVHAADNYYLYEGALNSNNLTTLFRPLSDTELRLAEETKAYLISFIRTGDPNTYKLGGSSFWPSYGDATNPQRIVPALGSSSSTNTSIEVTPKVELDRCDGLWLTSDVVDETYQ